MRELLSVLTSPTRTFERLREKTDWTWPLLVLGLILMVATWLQSGAGMPHVNVAEADHWFIGYAETVIGFVLRLMVVGGLLWFLNAMIKGEATYLELCKVALFSLVPYVLIELLRGVYVRMTGDLFLASDGPLKVAPDAWSYWLNVVLSLGSFLWVFLLTLVGTAVMSKRPQAVVVVWLFIGWFVVFPVAVVVVLMLVA